MSDFGNDGFNNKSSEADKDVPFNISEVSKTGYRLLRENKIHDAIDCFSNILKIDEDNNYALVGMG
ncbi:MAG: hypothetical protein LBC52_06190, partial [Treponema sp.]|nr:hypothetical protein [Treponema sp.]